MIKLAPSLLAADILRLGEGVRLAERAGVDYLHVDIMDGTFVPNISFGPSLVKALKRATALPLDVHLMIREPERYFKEFISAGADILTFHQEASADSAAAVCAIHALGAQAGVSIKPATPVEALSGVLELADLILIMSVEPGFGGQKFQPESIARVGALRQAGYRGLIEVDGGVNGDNLPLLAAAGMDVAVMGTAFFAADDLEALAARVHGI